jgi:voltage-gated sodium channel
LLSWLRSVIENPRTDRIILWLIVLNAVTLGLETSESVMSRYGTLLKLVDRLIIGIFVVEILGRLIVQRLAFFKQGWNLFDAFVIGIALAPATSAFSVIRALRVLRVLRLVTAVPALQRVVGGFIKALPGMGSIVLLIALIFYVSSVMAVNLYGRDYPHLFGTLGASLYTLFTIMTLEGWVEGVVNPIMERHPNAWLFFIPFIIFTTFMVLNLFIGIIVNAIQEEHAAVEAAERQVEREAERSMLHAETLPVIRMIDELKEEILALRATVSARAGARDGTATIRDEREDGGSGKDG